MPCRVYCAVREVTALAQQRSAEAARGAGPSTEGASAEGESDGAATRGAIDDPPNEQLEDRGRRGLSPGRRGSRVRRGYIEGTSRVHRGYIEGSIEGTSRVTTCACSVEGRGCCIEGTSRVRRGQGSANKTWAAVAKLFHPLVAASQLHPVDVAQPEHNQYTLCGQFEDMKCRESLPLCTKVLCRRSTAAASPLQRRRPCSVAGAQSAADHSAPFTRLVP